MDICEKQGDDHGAAITYQQLGQIARLQEDYTTATAWYMKAIAVFSHFADLHNFGIVIGNFVRAFQAADSATQTVLRQQWQQAGLDKIIPLEQLEQKFNEHN